MGKSRERNLFIAAFLAPAVLIYGGLVVWPLIQSFQFSTYDWRGLSSQATFSGLDNFKALAQDPVYRQALGNNLLLLVGCGVLLIFGGAAMAHAVVGAGGWSRVLRAVFLLPHMLSAVVVAILWKFLYNPAFGLFDRALRGVGITPPSSGLLGDTGTALACVGFAFIWFALGFFALLFAAGLRTIPGEVIEAAELDGANGLRRFWLVTWPQLWAIKRVAVVYVVTNVLNMFALVQLMTEGTPDRHTEVLVRYQYEKAFVSSQMGYATAMGVVNFVVALTLAVGTLWIFRRSPEESR